MRLTPPPGALISGPGDSAVAPESSLSSLPGSISVKYVIVATASGWAGGTSNLRHDGHTHEIQSTAARVHDAHAAQTVAIIVQTTFYKYSRIETVVHVHRLATACWKVRVLCCP